MSVGRCLAEKDSLFIQTKLLQFSCASLQLTQRIRIIRRIKSIQNIVRSPISAARRMVDWPRRRQDDDFKIMEEHLPVGLAARLKECVDSLVVRLQSSRRMAHLSPAAALCGGAAVAFLRGIGLVAEDYVGPVAREAADDACEAGNLNEDCLCAMSVERHTKMRTTQDTLTFIVAQFLVIGLYSQFTDFLKLLHHFRS